MIENELLSVLETIARVHYGDIVGESELSSHKLRLIFRDLSFLDAWFSEGRVGVYAFHWERRHVDGSVYRHDNIPHLAWRSVSTWPKHFHDGAAGRVMSSLIPDDPKAALRYMLDSVREKLRAEPL